jgi:hypothetical protein
MADVTPHPAPEPSGTGRDDERERTIDALLVAGLDLYFAGQYEQAIHTWTRVLFLDRSHARARAYIDRARTVQVERQRETDELLHRGLAALDAGDTDRARALLASVVERGGAVEAAEAALGRLLRLDLAATAEPVAMASGQGRSAIEHPASPRRRRRSAWILAVTAGVLLVVAATFAFRWDGFEAFGRSTREASLAAPAPTPPEPLPRPSLADLALHRARALVARGHLHEALATLAGIGPTDPRWAEADRLRADVQRALLAADDAGASRGSSAPTVPDRP